MRSTSKWLAFLAVVLVAAGFVLLRQAQDSEAVSTAQAAPESSVSPELLPTSDPLASQPERLPAEPGAQPASLLEDPTRLGPLAAVTGRVVDERGAPVGGVRVFLLAADFDDAEAFEQLGQLSHPPSGCVSADDGQFRLRQCADGTCMLVLAPRGGVSQIATKLVVLSDATVALGDVVLRAARVVSGYVTDETQQPIAGAEVLVTDSTSIVEALVAMAGLQESRLVDFGVVPSEAWVQSFVRALPQSVLTSTAKDGRFEALLVHSVDWDVDIAARAPGYTMVLSGGFSDGGSVVLCRAASRVAGRVTCADGRPPPADTFVKARSVSADAGGSPFGRIVRAGPDGQFAIEGLTDESCQLQAAAPDSPPSVILEVAAGTSDARLVLQPPVEIEAHVTLDGAAVDDFDIVLIRVAHLLRPASPPTWHHAGPGAAGVLLLTGLGADDVIVQAFAGDRCSAPQLADAAKGRSRRVLDLPLVDGRHLAGVIRRSGGGEPIPGARVGASVQGFPAPALASDVTGADGRFRIGPIPPGEVALNVKAAGYDELVYGVPADVAAPIEVQLTSRAVVQVRPGPVLRDAMRRGKVTPTESEFQVHAVSLDSHRDDVLSALHPNGAFFDGLPPGRYRLELGSAQSAEFTVARGELVTVEF